MTNYCQCSVVYADMTKPLRGLFFAVAVVLSGCQPDELPPPPANDSLQEAQLTFSQDEVIRPVYPQGACTRFEEITRNFCATTYIVVEPPYEPEPARTSTPNDSSREEGGSQGAFRAKCYEDQNVNIYLNALGVQGEQRARLEPKIRSALWAEGFTCEECVNPLLVYLRLYEDLFDDVPQVAADLAAVEASYVTDVLDVPAEYSAQITSAYGFTLANARRTYSSSWSDCRGFEAFQDLAFMLAFDPTGMQPPPQSAGCNSDLIPPVFTQNSQRLCSAFFSCNPKIGDPSRSTTGISCLRTQFRVNGSLYGVTTGNIYFERDADGNCPFGCGTNERIALIDAYQQTYSAYNGTTAVGSAAEIDEAVRFDFYKNIWDRYRILFSNCAPHMSNNPPAAVNIIGDRSFWQSQFGTSFRTYINANLNASCP